RFSEGAIGGDGENYANAHHAKAATLESGSHFDKHSNDVAYEAVVSFLSLVGLIGGTAPVLARPPEVIEMYWGRLKQCEDFGYAGDMTNFHQVAKGEAFAFEKGRPLLVDEDSYVLIPMKPQETRLGEEVCYLGRRLIAWEKETDDAGMQASSPSA